MIGTMRSMPSSYLILEMGTSIPLLRICQLVPMYPHIED